MLLGLRTMLGVFLLFLSVQMSHQAVNFDLMPNTFDDQYIGCTNEMEQQMPKILAEEIKSNHQFRVMWEAASRLWLKFPSLPDEFDDNYGIALMVYTKERPYPIYKQLNGNISIAGTSRKFYMDNFHFKALHFYVTRGLQVLRKACTKKTQVYRGMNFADINVAKEMRFNRFASTSTDPDIAAEFGTGAFFNILTCFGVDISMFSEYDEGEILIPLGEKFRLIKRAGAVYSLESTGQLCSYFNCAYLGGEKKSSPVCNSDVLLVIRQASSVQFWTIGQLVCMATDVSKEVRMLRVANTMNYVCDRYNYDQDMPGVSVSEHIEDPCRRTL